jgi:hypothetical protein
MKFVLNTAIDPHFCAIFSNEDKLIDKFSWEVRSKDGEFIYDFLSKYDLSDISFCGGVSGPGGFASLRASAGVLNSLSVAKDIPIHQISAEIWIKNIIGHEDFLLNSFGKFVWTINEGRLVRTDLEIIDYSKKWFVGFLPKDKKDLFLNTIDIDLENTETTLLSFLLKEKSREVFSPNYEFPPV